MTERSVAARFAGRAELLDLVGPAWLSMLASLEFYRRRGLAPATIKLLRLAPGAS